MKYRPPREWKRGRAYAQLSLDMLDLPRIHVLVDGECVTVGFTYGNGVSDPVLLVDVTLSGTCVARPIAAAYWWVRERVGR